METTTIAKTTVRKNCTHTFSPFCAHIFFLLSVAYRYMDVNSFYYIFAFSSIVVGFLCASLPCGAIHGQLGSVCVCDSFPADRKMHFFHSFVVARVCVCHYSVVEFFFPNAAPYNIIQTQSQFPFTYSTHILNEEKLDKPPFFLDSIRSISFTQPSG